MDDAGRVRGVEAIGDLARDGERFVHRNGPAREPLAEVFAGDQLHRQRKRALRVLEAVNLRDVWMVQRRQRLRLALEPRDPVGVAGKRYGQILSATSRSRRVSRARYTSPMPPAPRCAMTSKTPMRVPGVSAMRPTTARLYVPSRGL